MPQLILRTLVTARCAVAVAVSAALLAFAPAALAGQAFSVAGGHRVGIPNPVAAWSQYTITGCGYVTGKAGQFRHQQEDVLAGVDENGCIIPFTQSSDVPGTYTIKTYQNLKGRQQTLMGWTSLTVF